MASNLKCPAPKSSKSLSQSVTSKRKVSGPSHSSDSALSPNLVPTTNQTDSSRSTLEGSNSIPIGEPTTSPAAKKTKSEVKASMEEQRKRTLEALERRFAQAKAEVQTQQQNKSRKRPPQDNKDKLMSNAKLSSADSAIKNPFSPSSSRKGNFSFSGHTSKQDVVENEPAYLKLSQPVHENLLPNGAEISDRKSTIDWVLHELFQHGDSAQKYMQGSKSMKIETTILLDNYVKKGGISSAGRIQALQCGSKRSKKHMSLKQHKKLGSFDFPKEFHNFEKFKPMHEKWNSYIQQLLKIVGKDQLAQCFLHADLHGAIILVVQCKIASHVGIHGIMVRETKETFGIITQENKFKVVPKKPSVFVVQADCWKITLHGDRLVSRNLVP